MNAASRGANYTLNVRLGPRQKKRAPKVVEHRRGSDQNVQPLKEGTSWLPKL